MTSSTTARWKFRTHAAITMATKPETNLALIWINIPLSWHHFIPLLLKKHNSTLFIYLLLYILQLKRQEGEITGVTQRSAAQQNRNRPSKEGSDLSVTLHKSFVLTTAQQIQQGLILSLKSDMLWTIKMITSHFKLPHFSSLYLLFSFLKSSNDTVSCPLTYKHWIKIGMQLFCTVFIAVYTVFMNNSLYWSENDAISGRFSIHSIEN